MGRRRTYTDEQLCDAVARSSTFKEVVERLRREAGGASHRSVRTRVEVLELDISHFDSGPPRNDVGEIVSPDAVEEPWKPQRSWTNEDLARAVANATSLNGVFGELGLVVGGTQWINIRQLIDELGLSTSHWQRPLKGRDAAGRSGWTDEDLREVVPGASSYAEVMRRLGLKPGSGTQSRIVARIKELNLDTSHMTGQAWLRGRKNPKPNYRRALEEILVADSDYLCNRTLKKRLVREGLKKYRCESCHTSEWNGQRLSLHLDHVNGDRRDNRLENLRFLCPNCHSLTDTYCGRNRGRYASETVGCYAVA